MYKLIPFTLLALSTLATADTRNQNLMDVAAGNEDFSTLVTALKAADLTVRDGTFTVLAPTNAAFDKLPGQTLNDLLKPENKARLQAVLSYHLIEKQAPLSRLLQSGEANTVEGSPVRVTFKDGRIRVNDATLETADIACANGIIHVIDTVLLPPEKGPKNLVETAKEAGSFNTLLAAATAAGLVDTLSGEGPLTVFAPTDEAFARIPGHTLDRLLKPENKHELVNLLSYHVVKGKVSAGDALNAGAARALNGMTIPFSYKDGGLKAQWATVQAADVEASNGIIHVIDRVMMPPKKKAARTTKDAIGLIATAIDKGVPTYNHGNPSGCAAIYMEASNELMKNHPMPNSAMTALKHAVSRAGHSSCADTRAWTLRQGLDRAYTALRHEMKMAND